MEIRAERTITLSSELSKDFQNKLGEEGGWNSIKIFLRDLIIPSGLNSGGKERKEPARKQTQGKFTKRYFFGCGFFGERKTSPLNSSYRGTLLKGFGRENAEDEKKDWRQNLISLEKVGQKGSHKEEAGGKRHVKGGMGIGEHL